MRLVSSVASFVGGLVLVTSGARGALVAGYNFEEGVGSSAGDSAPATAGDNSASLLSNASFVPGGAPNNGGLFALDVDSSATGGATLANVGTLLQDVPGATLAAWVNPDAYPSSGSFVNTVFVANNAISAASSRAALQVGPNGSVRAGGRRLDSNSFNSALTETGHVPLNTWTHIAAVYNFATDGSIDVYVNGQPVTSTRSNNFNGTGNTSNTASVAAAIGLRPAVAGFDESLNGQLDNVQIYNTALTATEVAALVPEPASLAFLSVGLLGLLARRRRSI